MADLMEMLSEAVITFFSIRSRIFTYITVIL
jgi:hypothetical protein